LTRLKEGEAEPMQDIGIVGRQLCCLTQGRERRRPLAGLVQPGGLGQ